MADKLIPTKVYVQDERLTMELADGRIIAVPVAWHPRLAYARPTDQATYRVEDFGTYTSVHWPTLNEDIRPADLLAGRRSLESETSLQAWRAAYDQGDVWAIVPHVEVNFHDEAVTTDAAP